MLLLFLVRTIHLQETDVDDNAIIVNSFYFLRVTLKSWNKFFGRFAGLCNSVLSWDFNRLWPRFREESALSEDAFL